MAYKGYKGCGPKKLGASPIKQRQSVMQKEDGSAYTKQDADNDHKRKLAASVKDVSVESTRKGGSVGGGMISGGKVLSGATQIAKFAAKHIAKKGGAKAVNKLLNN